MRAWRDAGLVFLLSSADLGFVAGLDDCDGAAALASVALDKEEPASARKCASACEGAGEAAGEKQRARERNISGLGDRLSAT